MSLEHLPKISDSFEEFDIYGITGFLKIPRKLFHTFILTEDHDSIEEFIIWSNEVMTKYEIVFRTNNMFDIDKKSYNQIIIKTPDDNEAMLIKLVWM